MRCRSERRVETHRSRDGASPAAAAILKVAAFPIGHSAVCNCSQSNGKVKPEDCDGLVVYNGDDEEIARFRGKDFRAQLAGDGRVLIYNMPGETCDRAFNLGNAVVALNRKDEEFWRSRYEED